MPDDNITQLFPNADPDTILKKAQGKYDAVIVIGATAEDALEIEASANLSDVMLLYFLTRSLHIVNTTFDEIEAEE